MQTYGDMVIGSVSLAGSVPREWKKTRVLAFAKERKQFAEDESEQLLSISEYFGVAPRSEKFTDSGGGSRDGSIVGYRVVRKNDLAMNYMLAWKGSQGVSDYDGVVSPAYAVFELDQSIVAPQFIHYLFRSELFQKYFKSLSRGIMDSRLRLYPETLLHLSVDIPQEAVQQKIADFLDTETAQIDNLIAKQERLLELLEEKRRATITHAVTRGLNPSVELKETNIPWLGQIPKNWNIVRVKDIADVVLGKMVQNEQKKAEEVLKPYLKSRNIQWDGIDLSNVDEMWFKPAEIQGYSLQDNDIVVSEGGDVGKCVMWQEKLGEMYFQNSVNRVRVSGSVEAKYIYYVFQHLALNQVFMNTVNKVSIAHLTKDKIVTYHIPMPDKTEQGQIADFLDTEDKKFRELKQKIQTQITLLHERRTSLISHAVTGKVKV